MLGPNLIKMMEKATMPPPLLPYSWNGRDAIRNQNNISNRETKIQNSFEVPDSSFEQREPGDRIAAVIT